MSITLTNIFYYDYYKPYILKRSSHAGDFGYRSVKDSYMGKGSVQTAGDRQSYDIAQDFYAGKKSYILNTARKEEVVNFMRGLSSNITALKESARNLEDSIARYRHSERSQGGCSAEGDWLIRSLKEFAEVYNTTYSFSQESCHSAELVRFASNIKNGFLTVEESSEKSEGASILGFDGRNRLVFDEQVFYGGDALQRELNFVRAAVEKVKEKTIDFLTEPLSEHMSFKDLDYYYNYKYGSANDNAFQLIEHGLLLDLVI